MNQKDNTQLNLETLKSAVDNHAAAFRCRRRLQPAGGPGDKVFPPTFAGAVYAVEQRRLPGHAEPVTCVVLDTVQSQANNAEAALQAALDAGTIQIPVIHVSFADNAPIEDGADDTRLIEQVGQNGVITSLQVPHRLADAILRDSEYAENGTRVPFRSSTPGRILNSASQMNALPVYRYCPTALLFGMWDSTGPKGGLGAKFERAFVSEVVGVNAHFGIKTASRIDPIIGATKGIVLYQHQDKDRVWTLTPEDAAKDSAGNPIKLGKKEPGKVSNSNLGNVTPSFAKYGKNAEGPDPMQTRNAYMSYHVSEDGREALVQSKVELERPKIQPERGIAPGGVTLDYAEQLTTISLIALRRLRFPVDNSASQPAANTAAQTVLVALGLCAATLAFEHGMGLRSRCLLWPDGPMEWELLKKPGEDPEKFTLTSKGAVQLLQEAVAHAATVGVSWETDPVCLTPSKELVKLVRLSQLEAIKSDGEASN